MKIIVDINRSFDENCYLIYDEKTKEAVMIDPGARAKTIENIIERENLVFMLWGAYAKEKAALINSSRHLILTTVHPSPRSAEYGFFGCRHFSKANDFLQSRGIQEIDW